jgi:predicted Zn-dependent peptidase
MLLWLEADRMEHLGHAMTQTKLDLQRAVVRNERRQSYENEPYGPSELEVDPIMFPASHPYHIPVIGTHEDLRAATVQDVKDFFATWYIPNNASLCVAGDFDKAATRKLIADLFGSIPAGKPPVHRTAEPVALKESVTKVMTDDNVESTRVSLVWHSPAHHKPGDAECDILSRVLADGLTSRLQKRLMVDSTMVQSVGAMQASARLGSQFRIDALVSDGVAPDAVIKIIDEEIAAVAKDGPTPAEMTRIRNKLEMEFVSGSNACVNAPTC